MRRMKRLFFAAIFVVPAVALSFASARQFEVVEGVRIYLLFALYFVVYCIATLAHGKVSDEALTLKQCMVASLLAVLSASITCSAVRYNFTLISFPSLAAPLGVATGTLLFLGGELRPARGGEAA